VLIGIARPLHARDPIGVDLAEIDGGRIQTEVRLKNFAFKSLNI
jgi:hypothetical protein